ncbi:polymer-forming cytoskeletal protein [Neiella marina]|uniref:Polymer-forming cytoskeletal protein n=1 Tax=Neiella holothuriorum TaxID=2870530 RepID=A0ABS7EE61_9GAMM|nr:polymer-forming cytoskeletal protein [Neiella holothuriorum]
MAEVTIGRKGTISGDLEANKMVVSGLFDGKCSVNSLEICKTGRVLGEMRAMELVVAKGGHFRGQCIEREETAEAEAESVEAADNMEQDKAPSQA